MELEVTTKVKVDRLRLDRMNPRLVGEAKEASDEAIIARLYRGAELGELLQSVSANGYLDIEPLIVIDDSESSSLIVLEGNRRLATLRLLREPDLIARISSSERLRVKVPQVDTSLRATFSRVSVYPVASRERARSFIGFKHINGPAKWDAYAKGKYAADWYKSSRREGTSLEQIAGSIGDRHDTIKRMVFAIYVLEQAQRADLFDLQDRNTRNSTFHISTPHCHAVNTWTISNSEEPGLRTIQDPTQSLLNVSASSESCWYGFTDRSRMTSFPSCNLKT